MTEDADLVRRLQFGDREALGALYERHQLTVYRTALAITRDNDAANDILQEAFLRLNRYAAQIDIERPLMPWLYRVTVNLSYTHVTRRQKWTAPLEDFIESLIGPAHHRPEPMAEEQEDQRRMQKAIDALAFSQRTVIVLHYLNDLSLQEIAEILNCPVGTVKSRLHYGREQLRQLLQPETAKTEVQYEFT